MLHSLYIIDVLETWYTTCAATSDLLYVEGTFFAIVAHSLDHITTTVCTLWGFQFEKYANVGISIAPSNALYVLT